MNIKLNEPGVNNFRTEVLSGISERGETAFENS